MERMEQDGIGWYRINRMVQDGWRVLDEYEGIAWIGGIRWIEMQDGKVGIQWRGRSRMVQYVQEGIRRYGKV